MVIWRLVLEGKVSYDALPNLNFVDVLKLNALLDLQAQKEKKKNDEMEEQMRSNNAKS